MKQKILFMFCLVAVISLVVYKLMKVDVTSGAELVEKNVLALSQGESGSTAWFSILTPVECEIRRVNGATVFYYNGILIPAYGEYIVYGSKKSCERSYLNKCDVSAQTTCKENE